MFEFIFLVYYNDKVLSSSANEQQQMLFLKENTI